MATIKCPQCNKYTPNTSGSCLGCGAYLGPIAASDTPMQNGPNPSQKANGLIEMKCPHCGKVTPKYPAGCRWCGRDLSKFSPDYSPEQEAYKQKAIGIGALIVIGITFSYIIFGQSSGKESNASKTLDQAVKAETISCGLKTISILDGKIDQIQHEDGTIHRGKSVSENWGYDGKSIKHRLMDDRIPCGTKPKSRDEIVAELSSRFVKNPSAHGLDKQEARWMASYTANLMKTDKNCHLLVDAAKSTQRKGAFYIDCNDLSGNSHRYMLSRDDLKAGNSKLPEKSVSEAAAIDICNTELRSNTTNPATYTPSLLTGATSKIVKANGRNIVEIDFSAKSAIGIEGTFKGRCILESGRLIETTIENRQ